MLKKAAPWIVLFFAAYLIVSDPTGSAESVRSGFTIAAHLAGQFGAFLNALV